MLDPDRCYAAVQSRDRRFDGWFVTAVRTTGIYCRPSCPAITPQRRNVEFHATAAAAQQRGFRACKRCRPDASPGSPEWNTRQDVVARAMRLIADGIVDRDGVPGLARRLGYSERQLNRVVTAELGAGPLAIARAQRANTARVLIETTALALTDVAFAAGFGSVRQFNDTIRSVYACAPTELRRRASDRGSGPSGVAPNDDAGTVPLRLAAREPFAGPALLEFLGSRSIPGVEQWDGATFRRTLRLPHGPGCMAVRDGGDHLAATVRVEAVADLGVAVQRIRRLCDLDADPVAVDADLGRSDPLRRCVRAMPGRRAPGSVDAYETAVRAIIGQQVSVAGARTVAGRLVAGVASSSNGRGAVPGPSDPPDGHRALFPDPAEVVAAPDVAFSMPASRRDTIRSLARAIADGALVLDDGCDPERARRELLDVRGIGPWTADYVVMRGLGHPDQFLPTDLGVLRGLEHLGLSVADAAQWAPWRSYAVHHLWADVPAPSSASRTRPEPERKAAR